MPGFGFYNNRRHSTTDTTTTTRVVVVVEIAVLVATQATTSSSVRVVERKENEQFIFHNVSDGTSESKKMSSYRDRGRRQN